MLRKLINKLADSLIAWMGGLLLPALAALFLLNETPLRDWCFQARYFFASPQEANAPLVVLTVSTKKANELTKVTPRLYLADLIKRVAAFKPRVIALDYEFLETDRNDAHYDTLRQAIQMAGNVVLPCLLDRHAGTYRLLSVPPADLVPFRQTGYATLESAYDMWLQTPLEDQTLLPSFALATVAAFLFPQEYFSKNNSVLQAAPLADTLQTQTLQYLHYPRQKNLLPINYAGSIQDKRLALHDADKFLQRAYHKDFWQPILKDKIVLIGSTCRQPDGSDQFETPYGTMFGVEVHANIINNLLTRPPNYLNPLAGGWTIFFALVTLAIAALSLRRLRLKLAFGVTLGWLLVYLVTGFFLFAQRNLILPLAWPLKIGIVGFLLIYALQRRGPLKRVRKFLDFEILMEETEQAHHYKLRVISAPGQAGDAKAEVSWQQKDELTKNLKRLQMGRADQAFLQNFGHQLFQNLFVEEIAASYQKGLTQARIEKKGLRLRLRIDAPALQTLPWEYLYDRRQRLFLAANREILLTRYVESNAARRDMAVKALNVLIVLSNPNPTNPLLLAFPELDVAYEKDLIISALKALQDRTDRPIRYTVLEHAVVDEIRQHLNLDFHILHFIGHSTFRDNAGKIILEDEAHEAVFVEETAFAKLLEGSPDLRLVVLNSCKSATSAGLPALSGLAYHVIQTGVPAVVAMQYAISDDTATLFAREFYRTLAAGHPVDFAVAHARSAIAQKMKETRLHEFGIPVLFMRAREGRIF